MSEITFDEFMKTFYPELELTIFQKEFINKVLESGPDSAIIMNTQRQVGISFSEQLLREYKRLNS